MDWQITKVTRVDYVTVSVVTMLIFSHRFEAAVVHPLAVCMAVDCITYVRCIFSVDFFCNCLCLIWSCIPLLWQARIWRISAKRRSIQRMRGSHPWQLQWVARRLLSISCEPCWDEEWMLRDISTREERWVRFLLYCMASGYRLWHCRDFWIIIAFYSQPIVT